MTITLEEVISIPTNKKVKKMKQLLDRESIVGITETVPAYNSLMVHYRPEVIGFSELCEKLKTYEDFLEDEENKEEQVIEIPVCYGSEYGPDLEEVAKHEGISTKEVITRHSSYKNYVYMIGFTPGLPYLGCEKETFHVPRRATPRTKLPRGAVTIWNNQTTIFPVEQPGGWQVIGRTPLKLFELNRKLPFLLKAGQWVKFHSITEKEYQKIASDVERRTYQVRML